MNICKHSCKNTCKYTCMHTHTHTHAHMVEGKVLLPQHTLTVYMVPGSKPLINCSWDEAGVSIVWEETLSALAVIRYRTSTTSSKTSLGGNQVALSARVPKLTTERLTGGSGTADKQRQSHLSVPTRSKTCPCTVYRYVCTYCTSHTDVCTNIRIHFAVHYTDSCWVS